MKPKHLILLPLGILTAVIALSLGANASPLADDDGTQKDTTKEESAEKKDAKGTEKNSEKKRKPDHGAVTLASWKSLDKEDFKAAIASTNKCIEEYGKSATALQQKLVKEKKKYPVGAVSDPVKEEIHANGLLNDVASCYLIQAKAYEGLDDKKKATAAYKAVSKLTAARAWDPKGWFWSPAEAAKERLKKLE